MLKSFLTFLGLIVFAQAAIADDPRLTDMSGRWVCQPDNPAWPQLLIDFTEEAYRRCDQNTCVTYGIESLQTDAGSEHDIVHIRFAENGELETRDLGGTYRETLILTGAIIETTGSCQYRGLEDIYDPRT